MSISPMILTKIILNFWDSPENFVFQKNNFYILFHDIFKKGWFIICFVSTFGIYRDFKWKWIKIEESPHIPWVFNQYFRNVRFLEVIQLNPGQIQVNQKIIQGGANGAKKKCSSNIVNWMIAVVWHMPFFFPYFHWFQP